MEEINENVRIQLSSISWCLKAYSDKGSCARNSYSQSIPAALLFHFVIFLSFVGQGNCL